MKTKYIREANRVILMSESLDQYIIMLHIDDFSDLFGEELAESVKKQGEIFISVKEEKEDR